MSKYQFQRSLDVLLIQYPPGTKSEVVRTVDFWTLILALSNQLESCMGTRPAIDDLELLKSIYEDEQEQICAWRSDANLQMFPVWTAYIDSHLQL